MSYELIGKTCATEREYQVRLARFRAWGKAHPYAHRTPNLSIPACITYVYADRYELGESEMRRLLDFTRPDAKQAEAIARSIDDGTNKFVAFYYGPLVAHYVRSSVGRGS